jgi:putative transposase
MELDNNAHSVFFLHYQLILVVKYRRRVIDSDISDRAREIFQYIAPNYNITLQDWNYGLDHVHIVFKAHPNSQISKFINAYKSASSRLIKKEFPQIRQNLWREYFWSQSFCLFTTGGVSDQIIREYIESQGENDRRRKGKKPTTQSSKFDMEEEVFI